MRFGITSKNSTAVPVHRCQNRNKVRCSVVENISREFTRLCCQYAALAMLSAGGASSILISWYPRAIPHSHDGTTKEHSQEVSGISTGRLHKTSRTTLSAINHFRPKWTHDSVSLFELVLYGKVNCHEHTYFIMHELDVLWSHSRPYTRLVP
jgi:hypothetical protein